MKLLGHFYVMILEQMLKLEESEKARREAEEQEESARREAEDREGDLADVSLKFLLSLVVYASRQRFKSCSVMYRVNLCHVGNPRSCHQVKL